MSLFSLRGSVDRREFAVWGLVLFFLKYNLDRLLVLLTRGAPWRPTDYFFHSPLPNIGAFDASAVRAGTVLLLAALPFIWMGVALTVRRLRSLGAPLWLATLFFVPFLNLLFFLVLCIVPGRRENPSDDKEGSRGIVARLVPTSQTGSALFGVFSTALVGFLLTVACTELLQRYGWGLFVGIPFMCGFFSVLSYTFHAPASRGRCLQVAASSVVVLGALLFGFAVEGLICIAMAGPIALPLALFGGVVAHSLQHGLNRSARETTLCSVLVLGPAMLGLEAAAAPEPPLISVVSSIDIAAPRETVWRHVVSFSDLPEPKELLFATGIAYPIRATIDGHGVGAVRRCEFSTGAFVEPIEVWEEPKLLKFSVEQNPPPMHEWSVYPALRPAHLDGYFLSSGGQFELSELPGGRTRLTGTTWYTHRLWPTAYWRFFSDRIIHTIHYRVLDHIRMLAEGEQTSG